MDLNTREIADMLGTSPETVRRCVDACEPPVPRHGRDRRVPLERLPEVVGELQRRRRVRGLEAAAA